MARREVEAELEVEEVDQLADVAADRREHGSAVAKDIDVDLRPVHGHKHLATRDQIELIAKQSYDESR